MLRVSSSDKVWAKSFSLLFSLIADKVCLYKDTHFFFSVCIPFGMLLTYFLVSLHPVSRTLKQMETIKHDLYEAPTTTVIEVKAEGAILVVSGDAPQYEGPIGF